MAFRINRQRRSQTSSISAPIGGLNDYDSIANMPNNDALILENFFPSTSSVNVRGGSTEHATGLPATGNTLMPYLGISTSKLFAASGTAIYDVTSAGAVGAAVVTGKTNDKWDQVLFGGAAGNFLVLVNGVDLPMFFDGSTWTPSGTGYATPITGVTASTFSQVNAWKNRLFFVQKNTLKCWFLGSQAIGGAASSIDFAGVAKLGGYLVATVSINSTAGLTLDDYFCAITSEGECLVYQGTDPTSAATFALVGNYRIGRPIAHSTVQQGGRWLARLGSDVIAITANGFTSLKEAINNDVVAQNKTVSNKIINTLNADINSYKNNFGWQAILSPIANKLIFNVPVTDSLVSRQYVLNTITGAWCKFTGWDATCFAYFNDVLYAIIGTVVYKMDIEGSNDFVSSSSIGNPISALSKTAFHYFGNRSRQKSFKFVRPILLANNNISINVGVDIDFSTSNNLGVVNNTKDQETKWGTAKWGTAKWGGALIVLNNWTSISGFGYAAALKMNIIADRRTCKWQSWDIIHENGGLL